MLFLTLGCFLGEGESEWHALCICIAPNVLRIAWPKNDGLDSEVPRTPEGIDGSYISMHVGGTRDAAAYRTHQHE